MMFQIDANHPTPLYAQLERSIRFAIATGKLSIGEQLPTVRQLAVDLRINANTVAKVYTELERAGVFKGRYHVLGGALSALDGVTPERLNLHSLRHLYTTVLAEARVPQRAVDELTGHVSLGITNLIYTHVTEPMLEEARAAVQTAWAAAKLGNPRKSDPAASR